MKRGKHLPAVVLLWAISCSAYAFEIGALATAIAGSGLERAGSISSSSICPSNNNYCITSNNYLETTTNNHSYLNLPQSSAKLETLTTGSFSKTHNSLVLSVYGEAAFHGEAGGFNSLGGISGRISGSISVINHQGEPFSFTIHHGKLTETRHGSDVQHYNLYYDNTNFGSQHQHFLDYYSGSPLDLFAGTSTTGRTMIYLDVMALWGNGATQYNAIMPTASVSGQLPAPTTINNTMGAAAGYGGGQGGVFFVPGAYHQFVQVESGRWFDPIATSGFLYEINSESLFTDILNFPKGFEGEFTVWAEGRNLGNYVEGDYISFVDTLGHGVARFAITGINPAGDTELVDFPLQLAFSTPTADFSQYALEGNPIQAIPEPETYAMMLAGLGLVGFVARRRKLQQASA